MNCAESQELLVDLAYGELEPARAAEVARHVAACPACRAEQAQLEDARKLTSALREMEEPPANFDEPILRAARAEAGMQADGTPGPVVEVAASVKPLGLQAARLDPHAKVRSGAGRAPWWRRRATMFGSLAAAAAVVMVAVSVSLTNPARRTAENEVAPIAVRAPHAAVPEALKDSLARKGKAEAPASPSEPNALAGSPAAAPAAPERRAAPAKSATAPKAIAKQEQRREDDGGRRGMGIGAVMGGNAAPVDDRKTKVAEADRARAEAKKPATAVSQSYDAPAAFAQSRPPTPSADELLSLDRNRSAAQSAPAPAAARADEQRADTPISGGTVIPPAPASSGVVAAAQVKNEALPQAAKEEPVRRKEAAVRSADVLEDAASVARRAGDYATAAGLYRDAAAMRKDSAPDRAAWDLAHAVECLAAAGNVPEAIAVRKELLRLFADQQGPRAAANSALRSVPLPSDESAPADQK
jgi:anti-sigma factor RsiW